MAKVTITPISSTISNTAANTINNNLNALADAIENTLSRDGTIPNQMDADIDLNNNDLINVNLVDAQNILVDGQDIGSYVDQAIQAAEDAQAAADEAEEIVAEVSGQLALKEDKDQKGIAGGYAPVGLDGKIPSSFIPEGGSYLETWDASTNTPTIVAGVGNNGDFYQVDVAGTQSITGSSEDFFVGDTVRFSASLGAWERIPSNQSVLDVAGKTGNVTLVASDIGGLSTGATSTVTTSATDTTAGRLLKVGDFGIGGEINNTSVDLDTVHYGFGANSGTGGYPLNNPTGVTNSRWAWETIGTNNSALQIAARTDSTGLSYWRTKAVGIWGPWRRFLGDTDIGTTVAPLVGGQVPSQYLQSQVTRPEDFGAVGDGVTNDTTAVQSALDVGGVIEFTSGKNYSITNTVNITANNTTLIGYGSKISHNTSTLSDVIAADNKSNLRIFGLEIDGRKSLKSSASQSTTRGIQLDNCTDVIIQHCYVHDTLERGIRSSNKEYDTVIPSNYIRVINNRIENCGNPVPERGSGIWFFGEHFRSVISGNVIINCIGSGITVDDVSSSGPTGLSNEYLVISNNVIYYTFDPGTNNSIGIWVGGSRYISVTGNTVRGYRNACMVEDSQANELCAYITVTGNTFVGGPVALLIRNASYVTVSGNTLRAVKPTSGPFSGEATGVLVYGYGSTATNLTRNISITGNTIISERRGVSFHSPSYNTLQPNGVIGVDIKNNSFIHTGTVSANDNAVDVNDGGVTNSVQDIVVEGNTADGFYIGYRYGSSITNQCIFQRNTAQNCTLYGFQITAAGQLLVGNTTRGNPVGIRVESNNSTVLIKDHTFQNDTANLSGTTTSVTKTNNYPVV